METSVTKKLSQLTARKYEVGEAIAKGGMGTILQVKDLAIKRTVAMKKLLDRKEKTPDVLLRFIEEAQITGQLEHPGIVPVHELGFNERQEIFYTMKYVQGETLKDIIKAIRNGNKDTIANYPLSRLLTIFQKVCDAVAYAHSRGVIHRDLKPENIMVGDYGEVLTLDWGLAKIKEYSLEHGLQTLRSDVIADLNTQLLVSPIAKVDIPPPGKNDDIPAAAVASAPSDNISSEDSLNTVDGQILGTPNYMSPEQATGQSDDIDQRSDIYTLGGILYTILTLCPPITGRTFTEMMVNIVKGKIPPPSSFKRHTKKSFKKLPFSRFGMEIADEDLVEEDVINRLIFAHCPDGKIPESLSAVAMKALARSPQDRYPDVNSLQRDIQAYQEGFATMAEEAGLLKQLFLLIKRHLAVAIISGVSAIGLIVVILVFVAKVEEKNLELEQTALVLKTQEDLLERKEDELQESWEKLQREHVRTEQERRAREEERLAKEEERQARERETQLRVEEKILRTKEQYARQQLSKLSAPEFVHKAASLAETGNWEEALQTVQVAIELDESLLDAWHLYGRLRLGKLQFDEAKSAFAKSQAPDYLEITNLVERYQSLVTPSSGQLSLKDLRELHQHCEHHHDVLLTLRFQSMVREAEKNLGNDIITVRNVLLAVNPGLVTINCAWVIDEDTLTMDLSANPELKDIAPLSTLPLTELHLENTNVTDLRPLKGMPLATLSIPAQVTTGLEILPTLPLTDLHLHGIPPTALPSSLTAANLRIHLHLYDADFNPSAFPEIMRRVNLANTHLYLHGPGFSNVYFLFDVPMKELSLVDTRVEDLETLIATPLHYLDLNNAPVKTLKNLRGKPLFHLNLDRTSIKDLNPLAGMPITFLSLAYTKVKNLEVVAAMPLTSLNIGNTNITDFNILRRLPLVELSLASLPVLDMDFLKGKELVSLNISDTVVNDLSPLTGMPLQTLDISRTRVSTGQVLAGLPLRRLVLNKTAVADLAFVRGLPLRYLELDETMVKDLSPLVGLPIAHLSVAGTAVQDLTPLKELPLTELSLRDCINVTSVAPLIHCRQLRKLIIPSPTIADLELLKSLPALAFIATTGDLNSLNQTAAQFWGK